MSPVFTRKNLGRLSLLALLALATIPGGIARAQEPPPVSGRIADVDDSAFPEVQAIVTLVDSTGRPLTGLEAGNFLAEETGAEAQIASVKTVLDQQLGVAVILAIDISGSMEGTPITQAQIAARTFVENLADVDEAAVISFSEDVTVESPLTSDRTETLQELGSLTAVGNTALYSGVVEAVEQAQEADLPRKAVILLSDGEDFGGVSEAGRQEALDIASAARVPIYAIGLGLGIDQPFLEALADASGGSFIEAPAPARIPEIYEQLSQLLRSQYVVTIRSGAAAEQQNRSLRLTVSTLEGELELETDYTSSRAAPSQPTTVPISPTIGLPAPTPPAVETGDDSGNGLLVPLLLVAIVVGGGSGGFLYYKRTKQQRALAEHIDVMSQRAAAELDQQDVTPTRPVSSQSIHRVRLSGPNQDETLEIGDEPLVLGSDESCQIQVAQAPGVAAVHARLWVREGNLVLHHLAPGYESLVNGRSVTWVTLELNDKVEIGPYTLGIEA